jgi:hypothetical protein
VILERIDQLEKKLMSTLDTLIATMKSAETALEAKVDAAVTHLEQTIKNLQTNGVTAQNLTDLQTLQAAISSFVPKPTITVTPATANVAVGATEQFSADVDVTWTVTGTGTIDANGLYTAPAAAGTDTVTATATDGSGAVATATVVVS